MPPRRGKKKADVAEHPEGFDHVGILVNQPPGTAGLPFIESSEFKISNPKEPIPHGRRLPEAGIIPFETGDVSQSLFCEESSAVFVLKQTSSGILTPRAWGLSVSSFKPNANGVGAT